MDAKEAIAQIEAGLSLEENWRDYDAEKEALAVLSALAESTQFAAYEDVRGRLVDALKERDALKAEVERFKAECLSHFRGKDGMGTCGPKCQWYPGDGNVCPMSREGLFRDLEKADSERDEWRDKAEKAEAELDALRATLSKWEPVIDAVADILGERAEAISTERSEWTIGTDQYEAVRNALAYREGKAK